MHGFPDGAALDVAFFEGEEDVEGLDGAVGGDGECAEPVVWLAEGGDWHHWMYGFWAKTCL